MGFIYLTYLRVKQKFNKCQEAINKNVFCFLLRSSDTNSLRAAFSIFISDISAATTFQKTTDASKGPFLFFRSLEQGRVHLRHSSASKSSFLHNHRKIHSTKENSMTQMKDFRKQGSGFQHPPSSLLTG